MPTEIERKYLVDGDGWRSGADAGVHLLQGYLSLDKERTVRVRVGDDEAWLTVKGETHDATRREFEYAIPSEDGSQLLDLCIPPLIDKERYVVEHEGHAWEVDVFGGSNTGLILAEIELSAPDEGFARPSWLGEDVTDDPRFYNANLVEHPFSEWNRPERSG